MGDNHLTTTVSPHTHKIGITVVPRPDRSPPPLTVNCAVHSHERTTLDVPHTRSHSCLSRTRSKQPTSHAVRQLVFATVTGDTALCYNIISSAPRYPMTNTHVSLFTLKCYVSEFVYVILINLPIPYSINSRSNAII
jgi:hypothetical protein